MTETYLLILVLCNGLIDAPSSPPYPSTLFCVFTSLHIFITRRCCMDVLGGFSLVPAVCGQGEGWVCTGLQLPLLFLLLTGVCVSVHLATGDLRSIFSYVKNGLQKELGFSFTCRGSSGRARDILALPFQHNSADFSHFRPRTKPIWSEHSMVKNGEQMFAFHTAPLLSLQLPVLEADCSPISAMGILNDQPLKKCSANPGGNGWSCAGAEAGCCRAAGISCLGKAILSCSGVVFSRGSADQGPLTRTLPGLWKNCQHVASGVEGLMVWITVLVPAWLWSVWGQEEAAFGFLSETPTFLCIRN